MNLPNDAVIVFPVTTLYSKSPSGNINAWRICVIEEDASMQIYKMIIEHGKLGGAVQQIVETIEDGKAARTPREQAISQAQSRINKKMDSGHVPDLEIARTMEKVNALGYKKPMLAAKFQDQNKQINWNAGVCVQRKYDGHRCMIINDNGFLTAYSRNGKEIKTIEHVLEEIEIPRGAILDGELYLHGCSLQKIGSYVKKLQPESKSLSFICYDIVFSECFSQRLSALKSLEFEKTKHIKLAQTFYVHSEEKLMKLFDEFRRDGYEGAIVRLLGAGYESKRSKNLLKVKEFFDEDFPVIKISPSKEGWAILTCATQDGKEFNCSAPGNFDERYEVMDNQEKYLSKLVNVKFSCWTDDGKPFHPVAERWVEKL